MSSVTYCLARAFIDPYKTKIEPFVIVNNNTIIGFFWITFCYNNKICILCGLRIDKRFQNKGYAKSTLKKIQEYLNQNYPECSSIQSFIEITNIFSLKLVKSFGFLKIYDCEDGLSLYAFKLKNEHNISYITEDDLNDE